MILYNMMLWDAGWNNLPSRILLNNHGVSRCFLKWGKTAQNKDTQSESTLTPLTRTSHVESVARSRTHNLIADRSFALHFWLFVRPPP